MGDFLTRTRRVLPWIWAALVAAGTVAILILPEGANAAGVSDAGLWVYFPLLFSILAAVIFTRSPGNRVAWLLLLVGFGQMVDGLVSLTVSVDQRPSQPTGWDVSALIWSQTAYFVTLILPLLALLHIFPTGRLLGRRWRWVWWVVGVTIADLVVFGVFPEEIGDPIDGWTIANPIGIDGVGGFAEGFPAAIFGLGMISLLVGGVVSIVLRYRRSTDLVRAQIKWVLFAFVVFAGVLASTFGPQSWTDAGWFDVLFQLSIAFVPISIALAITRYRLYDIDRIVSRTISYALVVGTLGLVYLVGAVWLPSQLLGEQPPLFVAGSTLAAAALFNPLRRRVTGWVDRRFYRSSYDSEIVVAELVDRVRDETDVDSIVSDALTVATETMQPEAAGLWVRD